MNNNGRRENTQNEHNLHNNWVLWEHMRAIKPEDYKNSMKEVVEFSTVEEFWRLWTYIPRPSEVLNEVHTRGRETLGRKVDAFSIFKKGIRPEWEDPSNNKASEWATLNGARFDIDVDTLWENMVLALLGETIEEEDEICGCRVVDRKKGYSLSKPMYRLELWLRHGTSKEIADRVRDRLVEALADGEKGNIQFVPAFEYKPR